MDKLDNNYLDRDLICVLFPGIVKNDEKALQCLGGIKAISNVYSQPSKKRLGLSFQPDNPYIKKNYADYKKTAGVLLKVKVKKVKADNEIEQKVVLTSVIGRVKKIYRFESMCEFQYVPIRMDGPSGKPECIMDNILPSGLDNISFMERPSPLFIVPPSFTRSDKPITYSYTDKRYPLKVIFDDEVHHRIRTERAGPITHFNFNLVDELPAEPHEQILERYKARIAYYPETQQEFDAVKKLFDERPIWSQNLVRYHTKIKIASLKVILPVLGVYMKDGPWRMLWVRYGYDPRKEPGARIYQTLDFRVRHQAGVHSMVMTRDQVVHYKKADRVRHIQRHSEKPLLTEDVSEGAVYFRPGMTPTQRQIFYQYCDVKLPEVETLLATETPPGSLCHQKRGWLPPSAGEQCRDHIFRYAKQTLLATHSAVLKFEQASSDEEGASSSLSETDEPSNNTT